MPLLVIAFQHLRGESEICSKRGTFNRRQSASSEPCNHHIIHYEPAVLFLPVLVVMSGDLFLQPAPFGCFPPLKQTCICSGSLKDPVSILLSFASVLALMERHPLSFVCPSACVCFCVGVTRVCFAIVPEPCGQVKAASLVCVECVFLQHISFHMDQLSVNSYC